MELSSTTLLLAVVVVVILVLVIGRCKVDCDKNKSEKYQRAELGQQNISMFGRSGVDNYLDPRNNPHYLANPGSKYGPLSNGVDLFYEERKLDPSNGYVLYSQYDNEWSGSKHPAVNIPADQASRFHLTGMGDVALARSLIGANSPMNVAGGMDVGMARAGRFGTDLNRRGGGMNEAQMAVQRARDNALSMSVQRSEGARYY
jgi:hypothetical protein